MRQLYWEIRGLGADLVGAANDTPETNEELRQRLDLPFTLLSDENADVARTYGAFHEDEPRGRSIARVSVFLIRAADDGGTIAWEYVGPTERHRVALSRLSEEIQTMMGVSRQTVSVVVPSPWQVERTIAGFQDPPLGLYRTPEDLNEPGVLVYRDYQRELAMLSHAEMHRLAKEGWTLAAVSPEGEGELAIGQRYVFQRVRP
ncbi:MAG TPA: redoxin domain-containing protein [Thermomicrobiales bacterium]|nr:redoxin domain-containing protein [Thermomicrobiales bacterium]